MERIGISKPIYLQTNKTEFFVWLPKENKVTIVADEKERYWTLLIESRLLAITILERHRHSRNLEVNCILIKTTWFGRKLGINNRVWRENRMYWKMDG